MKLWIVGVIIGVLAIAGLIFANAYSTDKNILCSSCANKCSAESNCGQASCGALNGGKCNCSSGCNGSCTATSSCGSAGCQAQTTGSCGCNK